MEVWPWEKSIQVAHPIQHLKSALSHDQVLLVVQLKGQNKGKLVPDI